MATYPTIWLPLLRASVSTLTMVCLSHNLIPLPLMLLVYIWHSGSKIGYFIILFPGSLSQQGHPLHPLFNEKPLLTVYLEAVS